jgi:hypothetical protein
MFFAVILPFMFRQDDIHPAGRRSMRLIVCQDRLPDLLMCGEYADLFIRTEEVEKIADGRGHFLDQTVAVLNSQIQISGIQRVEVKRILDVVGDAHERADRPIFRSATAVLQAEGQEDRAIRLSHMQSRTGIATARASALSPCGSTALRRRPEE